MTTTTPPVVVVVVGMDVGTESSRVVLGSTLSCEIVRSPAGSCSTPTAVHFAHKSRQMGETAVQRGAITNIPRLLMTLEESNNNNNTLLQAFDPFETHLEHDTKSVTVEYNGGPQRFSSAAVLAMLLSQLRTSAQATIHRVSGGTTTTTSTPEENVRYVLAISPTAANQSSAIRQYLDAAYAAHLSPVQLVETPVALAAAYHRKFPKVSSKIVVFVDMGHAETCVSVVQFGTTSKDDTVMEEREPQPPFQVLSTRCHTHLGASSVDVRLWHYFQSTVPALKDVVTPTNRAGQRLWVGCHKLKHLLSQLPEGRVTVETVGANDTDVPLQATRAVVAEICQAEATDLRELVETALKEASGSDDEPISVDSVEVVGGGCRIPWVQTVLQETLKTTTLARSLDDTSAAMGAALVGEMQQSSLFVESEEPDEATVERRKELRAQEETMAALDQDESIKAELRNQIEAKVLQLRSAKHDSQHSSLLPTDNSLDTYLEELDDWIYSEECDNASRVDMEQKVADVNTKLETMCGPYFAAVQAAQAAKEAEMEAEAKQAQLEAGIEAAANGEDAEDHDNRRLPKKRRMEIVMKNKEEANELFKDGNWKFAAARYTKALTHCAKFVDLAPDDVTEVTALKLTLNLNLALAYMKLENTDQALRVCNEAVALGDGTSAKAFFRRASVYYEKKRWDDAKADVKQAKTILGDTEDKAINKLGERIEAQLKRQKQKEKKMASKMFG